MSEQFDEKWEYYVPDPEIAELIGSNTELDIPIVESTSSKEPGCGFRFADKRTLDRPLLYQQRESTIVVLKPNLKPCKRCGFLIPVDRINSYCSRECRRISEPLPARVCGVCRVSFVPHRKRQIYCSPYCGRHRRKSPARDCIECGKAFYAYRSRTRYCSKQCWRTHKARPRPKDMLCPRCGVTFKLDSRFTKSRYCSPKCAYASNGAERVLPDRECNQCKSVFRPHHRGMRFCSLVCYGAVKAIKVHSQGCPGCGGVVPDTPTRSGVPRKYCSAKCRVKIRNHNHLLRKKGAVLNG